MSTKIEHTVTITVPAGNVFDARKKAANLTKFASLDMEDQERIEQLINSPKALTAMKKNWKMLKMTFGV